MLVCRFFAGFREAVPAFTILTESTLVSCESDIANDSIIDETDACIRVCPFFPGTRAERLDW